MTISAQHITKTYDASTRRTTVTFDVLLNAETHAIWYEAPSEVIDCPLGDIALSTLLVIAMKCGQDLHIDAPVSAGLIEQLGEYQRIFSGWNPGEYSIIGVTAASEITTPPAQKETGLFFSGGIDALYSFVKHKDTIDKLVFVHGFDIKYHDDLVFNKVYQSLQGMAEELECPLYMVKTNVRAVSDKIVSWGMYHGGPMAAVGQLFSHTTSRMIIGSSYTYDTLFPWGTHPETDALWSTPCVGFEHDGCEATRIQKLKAITVIPTILLRLRVCYQNRGGDYNCGRCIKCIRTMINLAVINESQLIEPAFGRKLTMKTVRNVRALKISERTFMDSNLAAAKENNAPQELIDALEFALAAKKERLATTIRTKMYRTGLFFYHLLPLGLRLRVRSFILSVTRS